MVRKLTKTQIRQLNNPRKVYENRGKQLRNEAPPANVDDQPIPKSLTRLMELRNKVKEKKKPKRKSKNEENADFKQFPGETDKQFLYRINKICETVKKEAAFEQKYNVQIKTCGNEKIVVKRPKDEVELMLEKIKKDKRKKKQETPSKSEKRKVKLAEKKKKKLMKINEKNEEKNLGNFQKKNNKSAIVDKGLANYKNNQADAPPIFTTLPKKVGGNSQFKKNSGKAVKKSQERGQNEVLHRTIDRKGKRKNLPNALRRQLEGNQQEIIEAYKLLKSKTSNK